ncbi:MAG: four helix bundle protein [Patescibacteria group bacterium]
MNKSNNNPKNLLKNKCFKFSIDIMHFAKSFKFDSINHILLNQLVRSATSVGANIVEAFGSGTKKGFLNYFSIAYKSAKETIYWLYIFRETKIGDQKELEKLIEQCTQLNKMIAASILTIKGKR